MALIKRKQLDLYIKAAPDGTYGLSNLSGIASGIYAITNGDQYETVVDKIVAAIDQLGITTANSYYTYTVDGGSSKQVTLGGSVDFGGTANQINLSKVDSTNGVDYTFALPSTLITPGSLKVTTTTELVGNVTLSGNSQTVTHTGTGNLTITSTNGNTLIEGTTFTGNDVSIPGSLGVTGDVTVSGNLNVTGNVTQTSVNDLIVADRFIKLANGNTGAVAVTGIYQQIGLSTYAGLIYNSSENQFRLFTSTVEPTTSSSMSVLTAATLKIGNLDAAQAEFVSLGQNAKEAIQDLMNATLVDGVGINLTYSDAGSVGTGTITIEVDTAELAGLFNLQVKTFEDSDTPNQYGVNLLSESLTFTDSDTALVKKVSGAEVLKVITRGTIHEEIDYAASAAAGKFTLSGGNATITLSYNISSGEFKDIKQLKEYVQVFINGVKCRYTECNWTAGQATVTVYGGSYSSGGYVGVGFDLDQSDVFTVLYYGDKTDSNFNNQVTTTTTASTTTTTTASTTTTTAAPTTTTTTTATELFETVLVNSGGMQQSALAVDSTGLNYAIGFTNGNIYYKANGQSPVIGYGGSTEVLSLAIAEDGSGSVQGIYGVSANYFAYWGGGSFLQGTAPNHTGDLSAVGATTGFVILGTTTGQVWSSPVSSGGVPLGEWTLATNLEFADTVVDFSNMYNQPDTVVGITAGGNIFSTKDSCTSWAVDYTVAGQLVSVATSFSAGGNGRIAVTAAGSSTLTFCGNLLAGTPVFNDLAATGLGSSITGVAHEGGTGRLYVAEGTTSLFGATFAELTNATGSILLSLANTFSYTATEVESINRNVGVCGRAGNSVFYSRTIV